LAYAKQLAAERAGAAPNAETERRR
jgi:hypothetical protein